MSDELGARVGETRRLTIMFCDLVGSTELSGRLDLETYRELMRGYRAACRDVIETRFDGHIVHEKGDGALSAFGFPVAHENDAERAVRAALALVGAVRELSSVATTGESLEVRVAVHHGPVYLDFGDDDIYGHAANVGARLHAVADPGTVVISDDVRQLVDDRFVIEPGDPREVKGVTEPVQPFRVVGERPLTARRSWSTPLVERDDELRRLRESWARSAAGAAEGAAGVLVRGEAGVGKSRLVGALADEARAADAEVIELHGSPFHVDAGYHPVRSLVEARCRISDSAAGAQRLECVDRDVTELGLDRDAVVPLLAPVLGIDPSAGYDQATTEGRKLEEQVARAVRDYLVAAVGDQPAMVLAENLHWFDDASRALLADLLRTGPRRLLVVATSREHARGRWDTIELRPLTLAGRLALIDTLAEGLGEHERLVLASRSDGIPLYVEELVRAGAVHDPARTGGAPLPGSVPGALYEPLVARLYATPDALQVAAAAAAAGQQVDRSLLAETMPISPEELASALRALVDADVLEPVNGTRYQFRHELLREVAYELQPPSLRRKVHDRLCDLLAREESSDWHVVASHCERAERYSEAAAAYEHTAEWARRRGALDEARANLTRAIDLVTGLADDPTRDHREVQLRLQRGFIATTMEGAASADASADFDRCLELAAADPGSDDMFATLISVWSYYVGRAELDRAREVTETVRSALHGGREWFRPRNLAGFGVLDWWAGSFSSALDTLTAATAGLADAGGEDDVAAIWLVPNDPAVAMIVHLALVQFMAGDVVRADASIARAVALAAPLDFPQGPWSASYAMWLGSWTWIEAGRFDLAERAVGELRESSARHGFDAWELFASTHTAALEGARALRSGIADAVALSARADELSGHVAVWQMLELRLFLPFYLTTIGALLAAAGDAAAARERYEESLQLAAETGMRFYDAETTRRLAHIAGDDEAEVAGLRGALDLARSQAARQFELRIALDLHDLLGDEARPLLTQAMQAFAADAATAELAEARSRVPAAR